MSDSQQVKPVLLSELLCSLGEAILLPGQAVAVTGVVMDSRLVQPGNLFVALSGGVTDGHRYIPAAIRAGACAVVGTQPLTGLEVPYIQVGDSREALAKLAAAFYGYPARQLVMIGVTGTDGKTTTSNLLFHILQAAGLRAGMISTVQTPLPIRAAIAASACPQRCAPSPESLMISTICSLKVTAVFWSGVALAFLVARGRGLTAVAAMVSFILPP